MEYPSCSYFCCWNYLPNELKSVVIHHLKNNSRLALRACSSDSQKLVDSVPFRKIHKLSLFNEEDRWCINITKSTYNNGVSTTFPSFDEFQKRLTEVIEKSDCINEMTILNTYVGKPLSLLKSGNLAKITKLYFNKRSIHSSQILKQINPDHLKKLSFLQKNLDSAVLDMEQMIYANLSIVGFNDIQDDQLFNFEGSELILRNCRNITAVGINNFIQKCLINLDVKHILFRIQFSGDASPITDVIEGLDISKSLDEGIVLINSPFPNLQLEIVYSQGFVAGRTIGSGDRQKSKNQDSFKVIESIQIERSVYNEKRVLIIGDKNRGRVHYEFSHAVHMQKKIDQELEGAIYVKDIKIYDKTDYWKFTSSKKDQIAVGILTLSCGNHDIDYLRQVEPIHLKEISIIGLEKCEEIYDLPQVLHAEKLSDSHSFIRNDQILKLNATWLELHTENSENSCNLTDSGINVFVKKRLLELNQHDLFFSIFSSRNRRNSSKLLDGLDFFSHKQISDFDREATVNSPFPEYQLELKSYTGSFIGKRVQTA